MLYAKINSWYGQSLGNIRDSDSHAGDWVEKQDGANVFD